MQTRTLKDRLLGSFPPEMAAALSEFNKHIARLDADYIIFMARKSLRLYDFLLATGGPINEKMILSDHVLDQNPDIFKGKKVCLVDDTLILGTTIGAAKRKLEIAGASEVTCHVFSIDNENWCRDLVVPEYHALSLSHERMLMLCAREVAALATAGIPYLSDFPFSGRLKLTAPKLQVLHSVPGWEAHVLTTTMQEKSGVSVYTILPDRETDDLLSARFGDEIYDLIELAKVRVWSVKAGNSYWSRFVPILTLRPMSEDSLASLFETIVARMEAASGKSLEKLRTSLTTPLSRLRFVQYALSIALGGVLLDVFEELADIKALSRFELSEATRLFGPWLRRELELVHEWAGKALNSSEKRFGYGEVRPTEAKLPTNVLRISQREYREFVGSRPKRDEEKKPDNLFVDLTRAFIGLHKKYELPARREVQRLGKRIFEVSSSEAPSRDRLRFGFAWRPLAECLLEESKLKVTLRRANLLSLLLDYLIDMGIGVPVLCHQEGILFRGYRYGEDVSFGDQELALAHNTVSGYLEASNHSAVNRLTLEKLLVSLLRVGVAREFLHVTHGLSGSEGVARIGFHLHGAVTMLPTHDTVFADDQDSWLSGYMVDRKVLSKGKNGAYGLGERPEAAFLQTSAAGEAHQLGWLIGLLNVAQDDAGIPLLDAEALTLISTCARPQDVACALAAELRLFAKWHDRSLKDLLAKGPKRTALQIDRMNTEIIQSFGYLALNSARMKIDGHWEGKPSKIITRCTEYLKTQPHGGFLSRHWSTTWQSVLDGCTDAERKCFDPWIGTMGKEILAAAVGVFTVEIALQSMLMRQRNDKASRKAFDAKCTKVEKFLKAFDGRTTLNSEERQLIDRLRQVAETRQPMERAEAAFDFGRRWLEVRVAAMRMNATQIEEAARDFGRTDKRINYNYMLWYDIIDSVGQKSGLTKDALKSYRYRVRQFKYNINRNLSGLMRDAARTGAQVYPWQGPLASKDDEKHIFIAGSRGISWLQEATKILLTTAERQGVKVRCLAINTDFAGISAYKFTTSVDIEGEAFWEHSSRLKQQLKSVEKDIGLNAVGQVAQRSSLWLAGGLVKALDVSGFASWPGKAMTQDITTEIENIEVTTKVSGGPVRLR